MKSQTMVRWGVFGAVVVALTVLAVVGFKGSTGKSEPPGSIAAPQIVFVFDRSFGADAVLARSNIKNVSDLRGKKIVVETGFTGHFFLLSLMEEAGLTRDDVTIAPMDTGSAGSAFVAGSVDVAVSWEPWIGKAKQQPGAHILVSARERPGLIIDVLYMNRDTIAQRRDDVRDLVSAMGKATEWYKGHRDEGNAIMAKRIPRGQRCRGPSWASDNTH